MSDDDHSAHEGPAIADGRFECHERLDSGGLGTVWRGVDEETGTPVAVKCDHDDVHDGEQVRAGFRNELHWFRAFADGPVPGSLVHFVDGAVGPEGPFVVTELLEGGSVDEYFADDREPGVAALGAVAPQVCRAVDFLHRNGVVHCDVKPGNVLERRRDGDSEGPSSTPVLIDLNSAVAAEAGTEALFHRDPYKPPELTPTELREASVGPRADVYALGTLCCFLLAGEAPTFESESVADWTAVDPRDFGADCGEALAAAVERATAPRPGDRYADAGALYDALAAELGLPDRSAVLVDDAADQRIRVRPGDAIGRWTPDRRVPHVVLPDPERLLSPVHASVEWNGTDWVLVDRSLNGTYVDAGWVPASDVLEDDAGERPGGERADAGEPSQVRADEGTDASGWWQYVLSTEGRERRTEEGAPLPVEDPPETIALPAGARIAPVATEAGRELHLEFE